MKRKKDSHKSRCAHLNTQLLDARQTDMFSAPHVIYERQCIDCGAKYRVIKELCK